MPHHSGAPRFQGGAGRPGAPAPQRFTNRLLARFLDAFALGFGRVCHTIGALFIRVLSTCMIVCGVVGSVVLQMIAFYYLGVLNPHPLIAALLYLPSLASLAVLRSEMRKAGTSAASGVGPPRESHPTTIAYLVILSAALLSLVHPVSMRILNNISLQSMWLAIGGTALFYYSILISEVLFATAINLYKARSMDRRGGLYAEPSIVVPMSAEVDRPPSVPLSAPASVSSSEHPSAAAVVAPGDESLTGKHHDTHESGPIQSYY